MFKCSNSQVWILKTLFYKMDFCIPGLISPRNRSIPKYFLIRKEEEMSRNCEDML